MKSIPTKAVMIHKDKAGGWGSKYMYSNRSSKASYPIHIFFIFFLL